MKKHVLLLTSLLLMFLISCSNDDPSTKSTFSIQQKQLLKKSSVVNKTVGSTIIGTFSFSKVLVGVSKIEFENESEMNDDESEKEIEYEGAYEFDVLNGTSSPSILPVDIQPGVYTELEFEVATVLSSGNSIEISGSFNDGINDYSFEFTSTINEEYEIENENGINLNVNETASFVLFMDLESLFNGVDFSTLTMEADNIIRINSNSNVETASLIEYNLNNIMDFEDEDDH